MTNADIDKRLTSNLNRALALEARGDDGTMDKWADAFRKKHGLRPYREPEPVIESKPAPVRRENWGRLRVFTYFPCTQCWGPLEWMTAVYATKDYMPISSSDRFENIRFVFCCHDCFDQWSAGWQCS